MNAGFPQGKTQTFQLPPGGYLAAPVFAGNPFATPDPYMRQIWGQGGGGGGAGGGFGALGPGGALGASTQAAYAQGRANNMALADELQVGHQDRFKRNMGYIEGYGKTITSDIDRIFNERESRLRREFAGGMSGNQSTVVNRIRDKLAADRADALSRAQDQMALRKIEVDSRLSGDALGQRERINFGYPDIGQQAAIAEKAGGAQAPLPPEPQPRQPYGQPPPPQPTAGKPQKSLRELSYEAKRAGFRTVGEYQKFLKNPSLNQAAAPPAAPSVPAYMVPKPYVETPETAAMMATTRAAFAPPAASPAASQATATPTRLPPGVRPIFYQPTTSQLAPYSGAPSVTDPQAWAANALRGYQTPLTQRPAPRSAYGFSQAPYSNVPMPSVIGVNQEIARDMARRRKRT